MAELATIARNTYRTSMATENVTSFEMLTTANPKQRHAFKLQQQISP